MQPESFTTLIEMLASRADISPEKTALVFQNTRITYRDLWEEIRKFGLYLIKLGIQPGDRILIALPNGFEFFYAFYGAQIARAIAVPIFPHSGAKRILNMARVCGAKVIVIPSISLELKQHPLGKFTEKEKIRLTSVSKSNSIDKTSIKKNLPKISSEDIAFLQYTSGSTGNPKGVILTHHNLLTNIRQMIAGMQITSEDRFVSWLPVYHDMGLILKTMVPFYLGMEFYLLPANLKEISLWLSTIDTTKATFTAAPDFAYRLCLRHLYQSEYDLSSLRVALNAAEHVRPSTIKQFHAEFNLSNVMVAGYGLAEATVGVSMWAPGTENKIDSRGFVSVGKPFPNIEIKIFEDEKELSPGEIGEIAIKSKANSQGYFHNPDATSDIFMDNGFLLSGDLGYLDNEGCLYIVSRKKNIIKRAGETISPHEIEEIVDTFPQVRYSAAVGVDRGGYEGEQVHVFAEIRAVEQTNDQYLHNLAVNIVDNFYKEIGFRPARVFLLKPKSIPMTHNGKIQHYQLKLLYKSGKLREAGAILYPGF